MVRSREAEMDADAAVEGANVRIYAGKKRPEGGGGLWQWAKTWAGPDEEHTGDASNPVLMLEGPREVDGILVPVSRDTLAAL
jgi:hypothetical protein